MTTVGYVQPKSIGVASCSNIKKNNGWVHLSSLQKKHAAEGLFLVKNHHDNRGGVCFQDTKISSIDIYSLYMSIHQEPKSAEKPLQASIILRISSIC